MIAPIFLTVKGQKETRIAEDTRKSKNELERMKSS